MIDEGLRDELIAMRAEDLRVRQQLLEADELGGPYVPRMEAVHIRNAERLAELIKLYGWPTEETAGKDGAEAAWLIVQHAIGQPAFARECLGRLRAAAEQGQIPRWHAAYLEDRIEMYEGRPQRYGTQWVDDPFDGRARPWQLLDGNQVNAFRAQVGLPLLHPTPESGPPLSPEDRERLERDQAWWKQWLTSKGWGFR